LNLENIQPLEAPAYSFLYFTLHTNYKARISNDMRKLPMKHFFLKIQVREMTKLY